MCYDDHGNVDDVCHVDDDGGLDDGRDATEGDEMMRVMRVMRVTRVMRVMRVMSARSHVMARLKMITITKLREDVSGAKIYSQTGDRSTGSLTSKILKP